MPRVAAALGWHAAVGLMILPMLAAAVVFTLCAKDSPQQPAPKTLRDYAAVLRQADSLWFCFFYAITFGGFVGLASFLGVFFHDQYAVDKVVAGDLTALCVFAGSFMRPVGGRLADKHGGIRMLSVLYGVVALLLLAIAGLPPLWLATPLFVVALALLGAGNGSVFQLVPLRFQREIGVVTGLVGAAGGLGGFFLPSVLGLLKDLTGTYASGFVVLAALCLWGMTLMLAVSGAWRLTWASTPLATPSR
jgi:NNP family nitrate/nitrite transporter-like MFS transporter